MGPPEEVITADTVTVAYSSPVDVLRDRVGCPVVVGRGGRA
jgi:hypothetical protein